MGFNVHNKNIIGIKGSSFEGVPNAEMQKHFDVSRYGNFELTDAIRPGYGRKPMLQDGYRESTYLDQEDGTHIPVITAAASREQLWELFMNLLDSLGDQPNVVLESDHDNSVDNNSQLYRERIDASVLQSVLWDYEDLLMNDGYAGIAVFDRETPRELQFTNNKTLVMYGNNLRETFGEILNDFHVPHNQEIEFVDDGEHVHSSTIEYERQFHELAKRLGVEDDIETQWP